jgi:hypothetical protein
LSLVLASYRLMFVRNISRAFSSSTHCSQT